MNGLVLQSMGVVMKMTRFCLFLSGTLFATNGLVKTSLIDMPDIDKGSDSDTLFETCTSLLRKALSCFWKLVACTCLPILQTKYKFDGWQE